MGLRHLAVILSLSVPTLLPAQNCQYAPHDTSALAEDESLRLAPAAAKDLILRAWRGLGYQIASSTDTSILTRPRSHWPDLTAPLPAHYTTHRHPGVTLEAILRPAGDSTLIHLAVRAACGASAEDLAHSHPSIENIAKAAAQLESDQAVLAAFVATRRGR